MTSREDRFEERMRTAGLLAGPSLGVLFYMWNPGGHPPEARRLLGILVVTVCFWMTEAIPLPATALLSSSLAVVAGVAPVREVLAPYADPVIFLFVGTFLLAEAFRKYGLDRRVAGAMLSRGPFGRSPAGLMTGFGLVSGAISSFLSNTATAALMTPIAVGAAREKGGLAAGAEGRDVARRPWTSGVLLMVAYGASMGGMATMIGTPPNLLVVGFLDRLTGVHATFTGWLLFGVPIAALLLAASIIWTRFAVGSGAFDGSARTTHAPSPAPEDLTAGGPAFMAAGRRWTVIAFALAAALWTVPALVALAAGRDSDAARVVRSHLPEAGVALLCACLLFVLPVDWRRRRFALTWEEGRRVNWGIILLFGGGLSLGTLAESTGLAGWAGEGLQRMGLASTPAGLLAVAVAASILVSEFASNTAAATLLVPIVIAAAEAAGFDPIRPAVGVGLAATCGFVFPVSTPPNAIVFGTGLVPLQRMIRVGFLLDVTSFFVVWLGLLLLTPLLPA